MLEIEIWQLVFMLIVLVLVSVAMFLALRGWISGPSRDADKQAYADLVEAFNALPRPESRAFTTVSVPRPPANAQTLDRFVGSYSFDDRPARPGSMTAKQLADTDDD